MGIKSHHPLGSVSGASQFRMLKALALSQHPLSGVELAERSGIHQTTVSKYVVPMIDSGLVDSHRIGRTYQYKLPDDNLLAEKLLQLFQADANLVPHFRDEFQDFTKDLIEKGKIKREDLVSTYLFGSVARGEDKPDSDIDLFVLAAGHKLRIKKELFNFTDTTMGKTVNLHVVDEKEFKELVREGNTLIDELLRDGIRLLGRDLLEIVRKVK